MHIAIPSKGRACRTTTQKIFKECGTWYVPKSEEHQYTGIYKNVVSVPNEVKGITATRNWILKNCGHYRIVFVDDDVRLCGWKKIEERKGHDIHIEDEGFWLVEFQKLFDVCEQLNWKIWGLKTESALRSVYPYKPFLFKTYITASCMGIINDGEFFFDESFRVKEDYEIGLRHLVKKGGVLGVRYLHWVNDHWDKDGGCKDYRTQRIEKEAIEKLIAMYPGMIRQARLKNNAYTVALT